MRSIPILVLLFLALALPAFASDGVLEINQTCAVQTGCFAGDTPSFPVTITASGSYRLTSNLVVPNENTSGISVGISSVSIDLNGFEIAGPVTCFSFVCTPFLGSGSGVRITFPTYSGVSVKNGSITGMGRNGVFLGTESEVTNLRVRSNGANGIEARNGSILSGNIVNSNGGHGIYAGLGSSTTISGNTATGNVGNGIRVESDGSTVSGNTTNLNVGDGIYANSYGTIIGNTAYSNGVGNSNDGIQCVFSCNVRGNNVGGNGGLGLNLGPDSAYSDNVVTSNGTGTVAGAGSANSRGGNYCSGTGTVSADCP